jgi:molecular chaperone DnaK
MRIAIGGSRGSFPGEFLALGLQAQRNHGMSEKPATGGAIVGIDLGTTMSSIACAKPDGHIEVVPNSDGQIKTPSVVFFDGDTVLVGQEAARAALLEPEKAASCFKRDMGRPKFGSKVCGEWMRPEVLSALVLKKLLGDAEQRVGPITEAVVTVPAYFDDTRRKATQDAGEIAGLETTHILNEPTAAALWYGFSEQQAGANKDSTVLIYDLGGGTFDATLMEIRSDGQLLTLGTEGDVMLGGKDWDARLLDYVSSEFMRAEGSDPREDDISYQELVVRVEEGKHTLSKRSTVIIPVTHGGRRARITISREQFKALTGDLLARTQNTLEILMADAGGDLGQS